MPGATTARRSQRTEAYVRPAGADVSGSQVNLERVYRQGKYGRRCEAEADAEALEPPALAAADALPAA